MEAEAFLTKDRPKIADFPLSILPISEEEKKGFAIFSRVQDALRHVPDFGETCKAILDTVVNEMNVENCSLMMRDPNSGELSICAARGKNDAKGVYYTENSRNSTQTRFKAGEGIAGWVLKEGHAIMVNDTENEPRFIRGFGLRNKVRSLICFPIREKDRIVGVFNASHSKRKAFNERNKLALTYISNQIGAALTSARFFLEFKEMDRLTDSGEFFSEEKIMAPSIHSPSIFTEAGEGSRDNGIFICASEKMHQIQEIVSQVADTDVTVLIQGESGVGKEVVARSIHQSSFRRDKPFLKVNCAALPQELLESELFGYEKGAFTGAYRQKPGKFELANGGTIFLDEIVEISPSLQGKLLQVLQDREFSRLGGKKDIRVDVRVLAATNKNIEESVRNGRFREDLFYRINVVNITIPPLRERKEEIPVYIEHFLDKFGKKYNRKVKHIPDQMMRAFLQHDWLGNVRELENAVQRFVILGNGEAIIDELPSLIKKDNSQRSKETGLHKVTASLKEIRREAVINAESELIRKALTLTNWNRKKAADILNISYKALLYKIKECNINKPLTNSLT